MTQHEQIEALRKAVSDLAQATHLLLANAPAEGYSKSTRDAVTDLVFGATDALKRTAST